jgi:ribosomal protein S27AE
MFTNRNAPVQEFRKRHSANQRIKRAIKVGKLNRASVCEICGSSRFLLAHHNDYNKPLEVRWLCHRCHAQLHFELRGAQRC